MPLIATSIDRSGAARIFFDMRLAPPSPEEERHIALVIERAFSMARQDQEARRSVPAD